MTTAAERGRRFRPNLWMTVCAVPALAILIGLGTWQLDRLEWKEGLIAQRTAGLAAAPIAISEVPDDWRAAEFRRIRIKGRFLHDREMLLVSKTQRGRPGYHVVTPLTLVDGATVLVNRGWVPLDLKAPRTRPQGQLAGVVALEGVLRGSGRPSPWTPDNDPAKGVWHYLDIAAMVQEAALGDVKPFVVEAGPAPIPGGYPVGGQTRTALTNNHLQYAITWYALAVALAAVYIAFHLKRRS